MFITITVIILSIQNMCLVWWIDRLSTRIEKIELKQKQEDFAKWVQAFEGNRQSFKMKEETIQ